MEIIVPAAGASSRFPGMKPKYLLRDNNGQMMLYRALVPYLNKLSITVGILAEHNELHNASNEINKEFNNALNIVILPELTNGPADTVYEILTRANIDQTQPMLIKDCDSFFEHDMSVGNYVCVSTIQEHTTLHKVHNKSFIVSNDQNIVQHIVEKKVVSDKFSVGGYKFEKISDYITTYETIKSEITNEIFVSHIIEYAINDGIVFETKVVRDYVDVGTLDEWNLHNVSI